MRCIGCGERVTEDMKECAHCLTKVKGGRCASKVIYELDVKKWREFKSPKICCCCLAPAEEIKPYQHTFTYEETITYQIRQSFPISWCRECWKKQKWNKFVYAIACLLAIPAGLGAGLGMLFLCAKFVLKANETFTGIGEVLIVGFGFGLGFFGVISLFYSFFNAFIASKKAGHVLSCYGISGVMTKRKSQMTQEVEITFGNAVFAEKWRELNPKEEI